MTTTLENTADQIVTLSKEIDRTETELTHAAIMVASMVADGDTGTVVDSAVLRYRKLRESLKSVKAAYQDALNGD